jgi:hypothetical protein
MQKEGPVRPKNIGSGRRVSMVSLEVLYHGMILVLAMRQIYQISLETVSLKHILYTTTLTMK